MKLKKADWSKTMLAKLTGATTKEAQLAILNDPEQMKFLTGIFIPVVKKVVKDEN